MKKFGNKNDKNDKNDNYDGINEAAERACIDYASDIRDMIDLHGDGYVLAIGNIKWNRYNERGRIKEVRKAMITQFDEFQDEIKNLKLQKDKNNALVASISRELGDEIESGNHFIHYAEDARDSPLICVLVCFKFYDFRDASIYFVVCAMIIAHYEI